METKLNSTFLRVSDSRELLTLQNLETQNVTESYGRNHHNPLPTASPITVSQPYPSKNLRKSAKSADFFPPNA